MANSTVPPDLASILATLSQFAPPVQANVQANGVSNLAPSPDPSTETRAKSPQPQQPVIDTALITDWSTGLRCVTKIAAQNSHFPEIINRVRFARYVLGCQSAETLR